MPPPKSMEPRPDKHGEGGNTSQTETGPEEQIREDVRTHEQKKRTEIDYDEELNAEAIINAALVMPVNKTWQSLLKDTTEATKTNPELGGNATKVADARILPRDTTKAAAPNPNKKAANVVNTPAKRAPHIIPILKRPRITEPAPPTAEVRENGQAGSADKQSPARQMVE